MKRVFAILLFVWSLLTVYAQGDSIAIRPLKASIPTKIWTDQYLYVGTSWARYGGLRTANNNLNTLQDTLIRTSFEIGLQWNFQFVSHKGKSKWTDMSLLEMYMNGNAVALSLGYSYDKFSYPQDRWSNAGINSHWLSIEAAVYGFRFLLIGFQSFIYLGSSTISPDGWSYNGFNSDCFNRITFEPSMGFRIRYTNVFMEVRMGTDMHPKINRRKLASYNEVRSSTIPDTDVYLIVRLGFRNFTTANKTL